MPGSIYTKEVPTVFGALDSLALVDGTPASAFVLRAAAMGGHRLLSKRETLIAEAWDVAGSGSEVTGPSGVAWPFWVELGRWPIAKMRRRDRYDLSLGYNIASGASVTFQAATQKTPWVPNPDPSSPHVIALTGSGSFDLGLVEGLVGQDGYEDELSVFVKGAISSDLGVTATFGAPNTGTVRRLAYTLLYPTGTPTWNTTGSTWAYRHALVFVNAGGRQILEPRIITGVGEDSVGQYIEFWPMIDAISAARIGSASFEIRQLPAWRLSHLTLVTQARTL